MGGGIGGLILLVLVFIFGGNVLGGGGTQDPGTGTSTGQSSPWTPPRWPRAARRPAGRSPSARRGPMPARTTSASSSPRSTALRYWASALPQYGRQYTKANTVLYSGQTQSACGTASNQVGPFYCPLDKLVYIDASFFQELQQRFGANGGALAKEYVVAHEYGHHVQDVLGLLGRAQQDPQGPESGRAAGAHGRLHGRHVGEERHADQGRQRDDVPQADHRGRHPVGAVGRVGGGRRPDRRATQGRVNPESWTHGSSAQRQKWFTTGYQTGDLNQCNTFAAQDL